MLIFLDIDGVMRRATAPHMQVENKLARILEETVSLLPEAAIVITSTWREALSLDEIRLRFPEGLRQRIIGVTPLALRVDDCPRHREVRAFLKRHPRPDRPWVAIDDQPDHYPPLENILVVDPDRGFDWAAAGRLLLAAGFGPFQHPASAPVIDLAEGMARFQALSEEEWALIHGSPDPPPLDKAMRALWDCTGPLPGPVASPEGRWRTREEQVAAFQGWWRTRRDRGF